MTGTRGDRRRLSRAAAGALLAAVVLATALSSGPVTAGGPTNTFPQGQCTWWVFKRLVETGNVGAATTINDWPRPRDAYTWWDKAKASGWSTGTVPKVGAIVWWPAVGQYSAAGHVAFVEAVVDATHTRISESNFPSPGQKNERVIDAKAENSTYGMEFIYPPGSPVPVITPTPTPAASQGLPPGGPSKTYSCSALLSNAEVRQATGMAGLKFSKTLSRAAGETDCRFTLDGRPDVALDVSVNTGEAYKGQFTGFWGITPVVPLSGIGEMAQYSAQNSAGMAVVRGVGIVVQLTPPDRDMKAAFEKLLRLLVGRV